MANSIFNDFICVVPVYMYLLKLSFVDMETMWMSMATNGLHSSVICACILLLALRSNVVVCVCVCVEGVGSGKIIQE